MSVSLSTLVNVTVEVNNPSAVSSDFSLGLIIGESSVLTEQNRVKVYSRDTFLQDMIADGFASSSAEVVCATAYFTQQPVAQNVAIGVKLTDESDADSVVASREFNNEFYAVCFAYSVDAVSIASVASAVDTMVVPTVLLYQTSDVNCLLPNTTNIMKQLQDSGAKKAVGFYSTKDNFISGVLGLLCGLNSLEQNSAYTLSYKQVAGFEPEEITDSQMLAITSYNGNVFCLFGKTYKFIRPGLMSDGLKVDERFMFDAIQYLIQQNVIAGLVASRVIPQTESGVAEIVSFITAGCELLATAGFIATGIWTGSTVLNLESGDAVPGGYLIQSMPISSQSAEDRQARKAPPIYVTLKSAGAIENVTVLVVVNQ